MNVHMNRSCVMLLLAITCSHVCNLAKKIILCIKFARCIRLPPFRFPAQSSLLKFFIHSGPISNIGLFSKVMVKPIRSFTIFVYRKAVVHRCNLESKETAIVEQRKIF